jgi:hypothetical protein
MANERWLVFAYEPAALFSLKTSRATSTVGKTVLTPTPYAVKMAFLDAALRHGLTGDPNRLVRQLAESNVRIGLPKHACVTGTIMNVRQEMRDVDGKRNPRLPAHRATIAMREFVHYQGTIRLAFDLGTCAEELVNVLICAAPAIVHRRYVFWRVHRSSPRTGRRFSLPRTLAIQRNNTGLD